MESYRFSEDRQKLLEGLVVPFAVYQFVDGRTKAIIVSGDSGNAALICGRAGATAAPPMQLSIDAISNATSVPFVGVNRRDVDAFWVKSSPKSI